MRPELARRLREKRPELPVIFTSGYTRDTTDLPSFAPDAELLSKPFSPATLARAIRRVLDAHPRENGPYAPYFALAHAPVRLGALMGRRLPPPLDTRLLVAEHDTKRSRADEVFHCVVDLHRRREPTAKTEIALRSLREIVP